MVKIPIIPQHLLLSGATDKKSIDYKAICVFAATGFFLDDDTYYKEQKVLRPGFAYEPDETSGKVISAEPYFKWYYEPAERPLKKITEEFASIFETIIHEQTGSNKIILPLSGGLDSRTQAAALFHLKKQVHAYGYYYKDGIQETAFSKKIASACGFPFENWQVPEGYLWEKINRLALLNKCYSEFARPRQMAFIDEYARLGDMFSLGHWGDVLFDDMGVDDACSFDEMMNALLKKVTRKGGLELATSLWKAWELEGSFEDYFHERIRSLLAAIDITGSANARIRAFKSLYWAPRWTSANLCIFESVKPVALPYYDERMCNFICTVPEKYLAGRQIQIEYLKLRSPQLASIAWQDHRPFNLYNYHRNHFPYSLPYRLREYAAKALRTVTKKVLVKENYQLQFMGSSNDEKLRSVLFSQARFKDFVPQETVRYFYDKFKTGNPVWYYHPVSTLLTLSKFSELYQ